MSQNEIAITIVVLTAFVYLVWCYINASIAAEKNRAVFGTFFASLFVSPFLIYLYILAVPALPSPREHGPK